MDREPGQSDDDDSKREEQTTKKTKSNARNILKQVCANWNFVLSVSYFMNVFSDRFEKFLKMCILIDFMKCF